MSHWEHYCERQGLTDIIVLNESEGVLLKWQDPDESVRLAAPDMLEALEAQAMADADPEASERKGYFERARELRRAALTRAGRPAWSNRGAARAVQTGHIPDVRSETCLTLLGIAVRSTSRALEVSIDHGPSSGVCSFG